jgi:hypothetical protein
VSLIVTAKKLLLAIVSSGHQEQVLQTRLNINYFIFDPVGRLDSDVEVFTPLVGSKVDPSTVSAKGLANSHSRSHAFKHGF